MPLAVTTAQALGLTALIGVAGDAVADQANEAIRAFNSWCFKAGQTEADARRNMKANVASFTLTFWDDSLAPRPMDAPQGIERRCEVAFDGNHTARTIPALRKQMRTPPVFGRKILLPDTHRHLENTALIEGRELLHGRVAVVHVGTRRNSGRVTTFISVYRLYDGLGITKKADEGTTE
ncbi:hypothetical protein HKX54_00165 [Sulfitobacter sp. M57]|uniref:hypothetical protein n=1 Tax=unclassified Sulfitobacter TaxID=196795 RepID=UPI0023E1D9BD|nr:MULTISPECIES: hypothetical protein [unclassified Sulfitobacter]MDF3412856.1 hypothetical protein [Sulfitobacter sp. KE5]MDF3421860.1 hypothetical protein [Sulfitobacter sp. KE43]MDF3431405.1 hypothetical protein [Sulfitobacter sp. KE42]MDF3457046.1 hypothetical protein [Sulfitobacter sp. S74]MDF3460949.1 hypothetical protein [Sulfitobacter sp. Ks18]